MATNEKEKPVSTIRSLNGKSINPNYLLTLSNGDNSVKIEVPIPKDFGLRSEVEWGNLSKDLLPGSFGSVKLQHGECDRHGIYVRRQLSPDLT